MASGMTGAVAAALLGSGVAVFSAGLDAAFSAGVVAHPAANAAHRMIIITVNFRGFILGSFRFAVSCERLGLSC